MFDFFKKKKAPPPPVTEDDQGPGAGWLALESAFEKLYPGQKGQWWRHNGVDRMHDLKNPPENPIDAAAFYDAGDFWHFVSFGMSDLYEKESEGEGSGFGYEFTFCLAKDGNPNVALWPVNLMVNLGRAAWKGSAFGPWQTVKTGSLDGRPENPLDALLLLKDPSLELLETPNGKVAFLLLHGVANHVRETALKEGVQQTAEVIRMSNPMLLTSV